MKNNNNNPTCSSVLGQLLVHLFHPLHIDPRGNRMIDHGYSIIFANNTLCRSLNRFRSVPRLVNVLGGEIFENGQIPPIKLCVNSDFILHEIFIYLM